MSKIDYMNAEIPKGTRHFFAPELLRDWVKENAKTGFNTRLNGLESSGYTLHVKDVEYVDPDKRFSLADQKSAILEKRDLSLPLKGTFSLVSKNTGEVVDQKTTTIAHIPYITQRNTSILNGAEYVVINQQRLKPGVYTRIKETGEAEAHINVAPGSGLSGKVIFHPEKALFVYELGTTQIKLYGLLHGLGLPDSEMEQAWGKEIFLKNKQAYKGDELDKFYARIHTFR